MTKKTRRLLEKFEEAVRHDEMKGSYSAEESIIAEKNLVQARLLLEYHMGYLESAVKTLLG
jgi:hypothetical protein